MHPNYTLLKGHGFFALGADQIGFMSPRMTRRCRLVFSGYLYSGLFGIAPELSVKLSGYIKTEE